MRRWISTAFVFGSFLGSYGCSTTEDPVNGTAQSSYKASSLRVEDPDLMTCPKRAEGLMAKFPALIKQAGCFTARVPFSCPNEELSLCEYEDRSFISVNFVKPTVVKRFEIAMALNETCDVWLTKMEKKFIRRI